MSNPRPFDHGELNVPLSKRYGRGGIDAAIDRHKAEQRRQARQAHREAFERRQAARVAEQARPKLSSADVDGATHVRDQFGWHRVVRVNAKSVSVETGYSWTDRIPLDRVLEAHTIEAQR